MADTAIFDVDGTLVDTNYQHALAWFRALRRYDITRPMWRIHRGIGMGGDMFVPEVGGREVEEAHGDDLREAWAEEFDQLIGEIQPFEGAHELLAEVKERGFRLVLASSGKTQHVEAFLDLIDGKSLADAWTTSDDVEKSKPEPDIVAAALAKVEGASGIMVGDSIYRRPGGGQAQHPHPRGPHRRLLRRGAAGGRRPAGLRLAGGLPLGPGRHPLGSRQPLSVAGGPVPGPAPSTARAKTASGLPAPLDAAWENAPEGHAEHRRSTTRGETTRLASVARRASGRGVPEFC